MKKILFLAACTLTMFSVRAQTPDIELRYYVSLAYELESGGGPANGFSFGYLISPGENRKYYIGANASVLGGNKSESNLDYQLGALTFNLTQRVFLGTRAKVSPFLDFNVGYRMVTNDAEVPITYGARASGYLGTLGFRYYTGGESTDTREMNAATGYVGVGCFLNMIKGCGMYATLGLRVTDKFEVIDKETIGKTMNHATPDYVLGYDTYFTKPAFITFGIGFLFGRDR